MENIKAVVLDLDGTLLNSQREVSLRSLQAVLACHGRGIHIIIATARPARSVRMLLPPELLEMGCIIYYNGAHTSDKLHDKEERFLIDPLTMSDLYEAINRNNKELIISFEAEDTMFTDRALTEDQKVILGFHPGAPVPDVIAREEMGRLQVSKILFSNDQDIFNELAKQFGDRVKMILTDGGRLIQIMNASVSKAAALIYVLERRGVSPGQVMVFGDDTNDLELFDMCGYPVAMGNAIDELKVKSRHVTTTNNHDGVAVILEQLLLLHT
jgi:Cof subfamily protein (haloacid dehalogenase superfamily)